MGISEEQGGQLLGTLLQTFRGKKIKNTLTQILQPMHKASEMNEVALVGSTSIHSLPERGRNREGWRHERKPLWEEMPSTHLDHGARLFALLSTFFRFALVSVDNSDTCQPVLWVVFFFCLRGHRWGLVLCVCAPRAPKPAIRRRRSLTAVRRGFTKRSYYQGRVLFAAHRWCHTSCSSSYYPLLCFCHGQWMHSWHSNATLPLAWWTPFPKCGMSQLQLTVTPWAAWRGITQKTQFVWCNCRYFYLPLFLFFFLESQNCAHCHSDIYVIFFPDHASV